MSRWHAWIEALGDALFHARNRMTRFTDRGGVTGASTDAAQKATAAIRDLTSPKQLRGQLKSNQVITSAICLVVILGATGVLYWRMAGPTITYAPGAQLFYDIGTGKVFSAPEVDVPLINAPSGAMLAEGTPGGLGVAVFACGDCREESNRKIGYIATRVSVEVASKLMPGVTFDDPSYEQIWIIAAPPTATATAPASDLRWRIVDSPEGKDIRAQVEKLCGGAPPNACDGQ